MQFLVFPIPRVLKLGVRIACGAFKTYWYSGLYPRSCGLINLEQGLVPGYIFKKLLRDFSVLLWLRIVNLTSVGLH